MTSALMSRLFFSVALTLGASLYRSTATPHLREGVHSSHSIVQDSHNKNQFLFTPEAQNDRILDLPGLDYDPGFNQFAGYLTVSEDNGRNIFYWYVESQNDPKNDPVVFWTNGGPGCSGLLGFGSEHGPYFIDPHGQLSPNPYSWNKVASMLYVEQPAGVGFSYSNTPSDYTTGDAKAAADNYRLIREFLQRFPERQTNDFYVASESYGGHYMPQLTKEILKRNTDGFINFRGFLVGNPYVDPFSNTVTMYESFYSHGLLSKPLYDEWEGTCTDPSHYESKCDDLQDKLFGEMGDAINPYAMDYPVCTEDGADSPFRRELHSKSKSSFSSSSQQGIHLLHHTGSGPPFLPSEDDYKPCEDFHLENYLNRDDVRTALHVASDAKWSACSRTLSYSADDALTPQVDLYKELVDMGVKGQHKLNMLVFSGDDDSICSLAGTQEWIYTLGVAPMKGHLWKPWKVEKQTAGYVTHFDMGTSTEASFSFATVHGAGHEVPAYRPMEALQLFKAYLRGEW